MLLITKSLAILKLLSSKRKLLLILSLSAILMLSVLPSVTILTLQASSGRDHDRTLNSIPRKVSVSRDLKAIMSRWQADNRASVPIAATMPHSVPRSLYGSSPPKCIKKCGACTPCVSVLVPIHATGGPTEYYPEAWKCKCGGKLFNP